MSRPIPDLRDPEQRSAYRRELMQVAKGPRRLGVALAVIGSALILINAYWTPIPNLGTLAAIVDADGDRHAHQISQAADARRDLGSGATGI